MKSIAVFLSCLIGLCPAEDTSKAPVINQLASVETQAGAAIDRELTDPFDEMSLSGNYLASQFAQRRHDWKRAGKFMERVIEQTPDDVELMKKSMVLAMGSGQIDKAISLAHEIVKIEKDNTLSLLFMVADQFKTQDYAGAAENIKNMPEGGLSDFMFPLLESWAQAGTGIYDTQKLYTNTIHIYHGIMISDLLGKTENIEHLLQMSLSAQDLTLQDLERVANIYAYIGEKDKALALHKQILQEWPENTALAKKISDLEEGKNVKFFSPSKSPEQGLARAFFDVARLLYQEYSDDSARVFAHMALFLDPELTDAYLLLAHTTARNERYEDAISYYQNITPDNERFSEARRMAADLLEDTDNVEEALAELEMLYNEHNDLEALIQIGDVYRRNEEFDKAVATYDHASELMGGTVSKEHWHLHYARGMSHEQLGQWDKAEADLKAALDYQPNHPFVLNYLGYAWADKGVNLKQSLELIRKAVALQPTDGYITDSLGWVLYRMGRFEEAVPHLEKAVELLPYDPVMNDHLGDAYWRVGRKLEARFQWIRAKNHSDDQELLSKIDLKLNQGLQSVDIVKEASSQTGEAGIIKH